MVGALLAASPTLPAHFGLDLFRENVRSFVRDAGGYRRFHAGIRHPHVRDWIRRTDIPRMSSLLKLSHRQNVPLIRLLTERIDRGKNLDPRRSEPPWQLRSMNNPFLRWRKWHDDWVMRP